MKSFIKAACVLTLALSLGACSKDDPKKETETKPKEKIETPDVADAVSPQALVTMNPGQSNINGDTIKEITYDIEISLPSIEDETVATVYGLSVDAKEIAGNAANLDGGSEIISLKQGDVEQKLVRAQILDEKVKTLIVSRFKDETLIDGKAYIFVENDEKVLELVQVIELNQTNSDETVVALIREFAESYDTSMTLSQVILEMAKDEKNFHVIQVESADGSKSTYSRTDIRNNKGK